jgi:hypothetical protein
VLNHLEKRAKAKKLTFSCKDAEGTNQQITYTRWAYPGGTEWDLASDTALHAVDFVDEADCGNTAVEERPLRAGEDINSMFRILPLPRYNGSNAGPTTQPST